VNLRFKNLKSSGMLEQHIDRSIGYALSPFRDSVRRVSVCLSDVNGDRGRPDKHCRIDVRLAGGGLVRVEDLNESMHAAISRAADRVGHAVSRRLSRRRTRAIRGRIQAKRQYVHGGWST
jgi:hypothetical protein